MKKSDVQELFKRIKSHYSTFDIDSDYKFKEWLKYLKDYDVASVNYQFDKWLKSDYAKYEPKVDNLIRFAKKAGQDNETIYIRCQLCKQKMLLEDYDKHISRENSVDYMTKMAKKHLDKDIDVDKYMTMAQEVFDEKYMKLLEVIKDKLDGVKYYGISSKELVEAIIGEKK